MTILDKATNREKLISILQNEDGPDNIQCPKLREKFDRIMYVDQMNRRYKSPSKVWAMQKHRFGISNSSAKRDYYEMMQIMGNIKNFSKEYERDLMLNWIKEMMVRADAQDDFKNFNALQKTYFLYGQFDKEDVDLPQQNIEPHNMELTSDITILGLEPIPNLEAKRKALMAKRKKTSMKAEDVEYTEVEDGN